MCFASLDLENIHSEGHTHNSTGPGIQPIKGIRKDKFDNVQGLGSLLMKLMSTAFSELLFNSEIKAMVVNKVSTIKNCKYKTNRLGNYNLHLKTVHKIDLPVVTCYFHLEN